MVEERQEPAPPPTPRWVKMLIVALLTLVVLGALAMLISGGEHGPGRHGGQGSDPSDRWNQPATSLVS